VVRFAPGRERYGRPRCAVVAGVKEPLIFAANPNIVGDRRYDAHASTFVREDCVPGSVAEGTLRVSIVVDAPLRADDRPGHRFRRGEGAEPSGGKGGHGFGRTTILLLRGRCVCPSNHLVCCLCRLRFQLHRSAVDADRFVYGSRVGILLICRWRGWSRGTCARATEHSRGCCRRERLGHHGLRRRGSRGFPVRVTGWRRWRGGGWLCVIGRDIRRRGGAGGWNLLFDNGNLTTAGLRRRGSLVNHDCR
jgi:hypothetical protein